MQFSNMYIIFKSNLVSGDQNHLYGMLFLQGSFSPDISTVQGKFMIMHRICSQRKTLMKNNQIIFLSFRENNSHCVISFVLHFSIV